MNDRYKAAALKRGAQRSARTLDSLEAAIRDITNEMAANGGVYPKNGGAVSMAEIARRAGINEATLYKKHNSALKERATEWLDTLKKKETVGRMRVRKTFQQRAEDWRQKHLALEQRHIRVELELQEVQAELLEVKANYDALLAQMRVGKGNVVPITKRSQTSKGPKGDR